ncbi:MAG: TolC family protein [Phycisphaerales bacterium JB039]
MTTPAVPVSLARATSAAALVALAGCSNPLAIKQSDYADPLPVERTRQIDALTFRPADDAEPLGAIVQRLDARETFDISLAEARAAALAGNVDIRVALVNPTIADQALREQEAAFEADFGLSAFYANTDTATASTLNDAQAEFLSITPDLSVPLYTGGSVGVGLPVTRRETSSSFATLNPSYTSDLEFSLAQPLLRGAGRRASTYAIRVASYNQQISEARTKLAIINQLAAVETAYWRLYQVRRELDVRRQQLQLAQDQLERAERRVRAGDAAEIEIIRAQAGVAERLEAIIVAYNLVLTAQRELKRLMNIEDLGVTDDTTLLPTTDPDPVQFELDRLRLLDLAEAQRMELLEAELQLARDITDIEFRENQALPQLGLSATYRINGLGDSLNDSFDTMIENDFEDWELGLTGSMPLGNEAALSRLRSAILTRLQRISSREGQRQLVQQEVLNSIERIRADWQRILAAQQSVALNTRQLEAEQRQFDVGGSTSTDVLDAATQLADAQSAEIRALTDYQIAQINLAVATGSMLGASRIIWEPSRKPELDGYRYAPKAPAEAVLDE